MSLEEIKKYYDRVVPVIQEAGKMAIEGFYGSKNVETKGNTTYDLVTDIDKKIEDFLIMKIQDINPSSVILAEESTPPGTTPHLTDLPTWIVDPIDGTINFIHGIPLIAISVALTVKKEVVLGIVYNPLTNELFSAIKDEGAYFNEKRIHSSKNEDLHKAIIGNELSLASIPFLRERTLERISKLTEFGVLGLRSYGSAALSLCYVANGSLDVYFTDGLQCWDVAAGILILQEAGGCASSPDGKNFDMFSRVLLTAGNKILLNEMVTILKECDEKTIKQVKDNMPLQIKQHLNIN